MTAKEALLELVDRLSEDEAAEWLARMAWESSPSETLPAAEWGEVVAASRDFDEGRASDGEEVFRKLGI